MTEENASRVNYLDEEILKEICHELAAELFRDQEPMGLYDDHDQAKVDASLNLPRQAAYGHELYPDLFTKAAVTGEWGQW
jgi:prophage maintenance system killer protein